MSNLITLKANPKMPFCKREGFIMVEADYSAMELRFAASESKDSIMVESFMAPEYLKTESGLVYKNPIADLHFQSAYKCIYPSWFDGVPDHELVERSKEYPEGWKDTPRNYSKTLNFAEIYLSTAQSLATRNHVPLKTALEWDAGHKETYKGYYEWAYEIGRIATSRGFAINSCGRSRWVNQKSAHLKLDEFGESLTLNRYDNSEPSY